MIINGLARIKTGHQSRSTSFENPTGARGAGGTTHRGRKGAPSSRLDPGDRVVLADVEGPGTIRHIWMTVPPAPPEVLRAMIIEVFYDGSDQPSISVPALDFFGLPHGRPVEYYSVLTAAHEGRGLNSWIPMPFRDRVRIEFRNESPAVTVLYYQVDYTLDPEWDGQSGYLHASFRRENPTTMGQDFVILDELRGPGRFLGCNFGVRVLDEGLWYGEGEVKIYLDDDDEHPTICGTGLEDYVGTAWGLGSHDGPYAGAPLDIRPPSDEASSADSGPDFVGCYRWHVPDPVVFDSSIRVTIQQIGMAVFLGADRTPFEEYKTTHPAAGPGWIEPPIPGVVGGGIAERVDDYCATAFVYCERPQPVPRIEVDLATRDIERRPYEQPSPQEAMAGAVSLMAERQPHVVNSRQGT